MSINKLILLAASICAVRAIDPTQSAELNAILSDAKGNLPQYMGIASQVSLPPEILQLGLAIATANDDSYTTLYSEIDFNQVSSLMTALPWYSSRLEPAISSALATLTPTAGSTSSQPTSHTNSSSVAVSTSSQPSSQTNSSSVAISTSSQSSSQPSSVDSQASSSTASRTSSSTATGAASSSKISSASSSKTSSASSTASSASQTSSRQSSQSNAAPKAAIGMGAGVLAAVGMLL